MSPVLRVSVIIPALNEEHNIASAVDSASAAGADEIIVVDGGSTDATVSRIPPAARICTASHAGRAYQQNMGAAAATGDVLLFLHADCRISENAVAEIRARLGSRIDIVAGFLQQRIDDERPLYRCLEAGNWWRARILKWAYGDQAIFIRGDVFDEVGQFPDVKIMEDLLLMKTLSRRGRVVGLRSSVTVSARRWQNRGAITQTLRNWCLLTAVHLGVPPDRLATYYPNDR